MEKKFAKGSSEWMMFMDYWALCQKYWKPEKTDEWWDEVIREIDNFARKYGSTVFVRGLCMSLMLRFLTIPACGNSCITLFSL